MQQISVLNRIPVKTRFFIIAFLVLLVSGCQPSEQVTNQEFSLVRSNDDIGLAQYLEDGDPNAMNEDGDTLLYVASGVKGGLEVARLLILAGADLNLISREGRTALHTASAWCNADIVSLLLETGARTDIKNSESQLAIDVVCARPQSRREQVLALFFQARSVR